MTYRTIRYPILVSLIFTLLLTAHKLIAQSAAWPAGAWAAPRAWVFVWAPGR